MVETLDTARSGIDGSRMLSAMGEGSGEKPSWLWTIGVFVLAAVPRLTSLRAFVAHDETQYWEWARTFFFSVLHGDWLGTIVGPGNPSITLFWNHTLIMGLKYAWAWLTGVQEDALATWLDFQPQATFDLLVERRLPIVLFNTLAVVIAYRLIHRLFGSRIAVVAAVLLALDPFYLADSRTSRGEGLLASLATLAILYYLSYWRFHRTRDLVFSGLSAGLALLTKSSAVSLVVWVVLATVPLYLTQTQPSFHRRPTQALRTVGAWGILVVVIFWLFWPGMWVAPAKALGFVLSFISDVGVSGRDNYFFGQIYRDEFIPLYYPVVYVLRVTPLAWLGTAVAVGWLVRLCWRRSRLNLCATARLQAVLTTLLLTFPFIYTILMTLGTLKRDWYLIPAFPALDVVAAVGLVGVFQWVWGRARGRWLKRVSPQVAWAGALVATLVLQAMTALPSHPYYYTYWNPVVLGSRWAAQAVWLGSDLDLSVGAQYLNGKPHAEDLWVATRTTRGFEQVFKGHTARWVFGKPWIQADYLLVRANHLQRQKLEPYLLDYVSHLKLDHVVTLGGVDYLWIYEGPRAEYFAGPSVLTGKAVLLGYDLSGARLSAGETLTVTAYYRNAGHLPSDRFYVRIVDADGYIWTDTAVHPRPGFEDAFGRREAIVEGEAVVSAPVGMPPGRYVLKMGFEDVETSSPIGEFILPPDVDDITVERSHRLPVPGSVQPLVPLNFVVGNELELLGYDLSAEEIASGDTSWLTLYWQALTDVDRDYVVGVSVLDTGGREVAYWLGRPVYSSQSTDQWEAGQIVQDPWRLEMPADIAPGTYVLQLALFDAETRAEAARLTLEELSVMERRPTFMPPTVQSRVDVNLGDRVALSGYDLHLQPSSRGERLWLTLYWEAVGPMDVSYNVFVHVIGADGTLLAQHDSFPADGEMPTDSWVPGEFVTDEHVIEFVAPPPGEYRLLVGMYDPVTGKRLSTAEGGTTILLQTFDVG